MSDTETNNTEFAPCPHTWDKTDKDGGPVLAASVCALCNRIASQSDIYFWQVQQRILARRRGDTPDGRLKGWD